MNIQNIQIAQSLFRTVEEKLSFRKENVSVPQVNGPEEQEQTVETPKGSGEKDLLQVVYPPFFPMGNTQDILSIEGVKLERDAEKSAAIPVAEGQKASQQKEIDKTDELSQGKKPVLAHDAKYEAKPGVVLDFNV